MELNGAVAIVTGGSNGIGKEIAKQLVELGAKVYITGRNKKRLDSAADETSAVPVLCDSSKPEEVDTLFERVMADVGRLDLLINNAGFGAGWAELDQGASALNLSGKRWGKEAEQLFAHGSSGRATYIAADVREDGRERTYFRFEGQGQGGGRGRKAAPGCRLFVGGLPREVDTEKLKNYRNFSLKYTDFM